MEMENGNATGWRLMNYESDILGATLTGEYPGGCGSWAVGELFPQMRCRTRIGFFFNVCQSAGDIENYIINERSGASGTEAHPEVQ